jgi:hypothetical protein
VQHFANLPMEVSSNPAKGLDTVAVHDLSNSLEKLTHYFTLAKSPSEIPLVKKCRLAMYGPCHPPA